MRCDLVLATLVVLATAACSPALAQPTAYPAWDPSIRAVPFVTDELDLPSHLAAIPGDFRRVFVSELGGRIVTIEDRVLAAEPLLDITHKVTTLCECGILGFAFSPSFEHDRHLYVLYTLAGPERSNVLARFRVPEPAPGEPLVADPESEEELLAIPMPGATHLGGWIGFAPDGTLHVSVGENIFRMTQRDPASLYGKVLRLDVLGSPDPGLPYAIPPDNPFVGGLGRGEVYVMGLRNPWRCDIDPKTGDLSIGDVGHRYAGELNLLPFGMQAGADLGWPTFEGFGCEPECKVVTEPVFVLPLIDGQGLIAGVVYRGSLLAALDGVMLFSNLSNHEGEPAGRVFTHHADSGEVREITAALRWYFDHELAGDAEHTLRSVASFGRDAFGEAYLVSLRQGVFKLMPDVLPPDCDLDLVPDAEEIRVGTQIDLDGDGVPDDCPCVADLNRDGAVDLADYALFVDAFAARDIAADLDGDRLWTVYDHLAFLNASAAGCP